MKAALLENILDAIPYEIVFVDLSHTIRYLNKAAKFQYYQVRGHKDLIGKSLFEYHNPKSKEHILAAVERFKNHGGEEFLSVSSENLRIYMTPVRDKQGELIGYFERYEANFTKS